MKTTAIVNRQTCVQVKNYDTGEITRYNTVSELAEKQGLAVDGVMRKIIRGPNFLAYDRNQYRVDLGDEPWPVNPISPYILVKDLETNTIRMFDSQLTAAMYIGVPPLTVHNRVRKRKTGLIKKRFVVKSESDLRTWEEVSKPLKRSPRKACEFLDLSDPSNGEFRVLPEVPGLRIYYKGMIVRECTGEVLGSLNESGYLTTTAEGLDGVRRGYLNHRLVAMAFVKTDKDISSLQVNHLDFNKINNCADNLEWVTPKDNLVHSGYNDPHGGVKIKPIQVRCFDSKEVRTYDSVADCSREIRVHKDTILNRVSVGDKYLWPERHQYRLFSGDKPWCENPKSSFIKTLDIFTGKEELFKDGSSLCKELGISQAALSVILSKKSGFPINDRLLVKYEHDETPWPNIDDPFMYILRNTQKKPVVVTCVKTGEQRTYISANECCRKLNIRASTLNMRLKSGNPDKVYPDGCTYKHYGPFMQ